MKYHPRTLAILAIISTLAVGVWALTTRSQVPQVQELVVPAMVAKSGRPHNTVAEQRHLVIVQQLAPVVQRPAADEPLAPTVTAIDTDHGVTAFVTVPLTWDNSVASQVQVAQSKDRLALLLNTLFASDSTLERIGIVATYPRTDGREVPAMYVIMPQSSWRKAGSVSGATIATAAQSFRVAAALDQ